MVRRRQVRTIILASALSVGVALPAAWTAAAAGPADTGPPGGQAVLRQLVARSHGHTRIARDPATGRVTFVAADHGQSLARPGDVGATKAGEPAARAYLRDLAPLTDVPGGSVRPLGSTRASWGTTVRYQQLVSGLPVVGGQVTVAMDGSGALRTLAASTSDAQVDTTPAIPSPAAASTAVALLSRSRHLPAGTLRASTPVLSVYDSRLLGAPGTTQQALVWRTEVTSPGHPDVRELVLVDAHAGAVPLHFSEVDQAASGVEQRVCDFQGTPRTDPTCVAGSADVVTDPVTGVQDSQDAWANAEQTAAFYREVLGRNSIDGAGMPIVSTVRYCPSGGSCPYPNAFWNGEQMVYGAGMPAADDVVGHELTHGVTDYTSGLMYFFQSGAINESVSDVMGELIDQLDGAGTDGPASNWQLGEDLTGDLQDLRSMQDPTASRGGPQPDRMRSPHWATGLTATGSIDDAGGVHTNSGVGNKAAYLITEGTRLEPGQSFNGQSFSGLTDDAGHALSGTTGDGTADGADRTQVLHKVANLYYELEQLMTPSTSYADLANLLPAACDQLVGHPVPSGEVLTATDCTAVRHAVSATEMASPPLAAAASPRPAAAQCTNGGSPTVLWRDTFEAPGVTAARWLTAPTSQTGQGAWFPQAPPWGLYPHSGVHNMWGDDPDGRGSPQLLYAEPVRYRDPTGAAVTAFRPAVGTYLWFAHAWSFDQDDDQQTGRHEHYDGGQVEYSVNNGAWTDAGALFDINGYTGSISASFDNPHRGKRAFVGTSGGYTASRLNLSSLAGKDVRLRFVVAADSAVGDYGWFVDDVTVLSCNPTQLWVPRTRTIAYGTATSVSGRLVRSGTSTGVGAAVVQLYQRTHGTSSWGTAVRSTRTSSTGSYAFTGLRPGVNEDYLVRFAGSAPLAASSAMTVVDVAPRVSINANDTSLWRGQQVYLTGGVSPNHHGQRVTLQRYLGSGRWGTLATATLSSRSTYSTSWRPTTRGSYVLRVVKGADRDHATGTSATVTVRVS